MKDPCKVTSTRSRRRDWLDDLLAGAAEPIVVPGPKTDECLDEDTIAALAEEQQPKIDPKTIDAHLRTCGRCVDSLISARRFINAWRIESQRRARRVIHFPLQRLWRERPPADSALALAAADHTVARTWEVHEADRVRALVYVTSSGELLLSLEREGHPLQRASVTLAHLDDAGKRLQCIDRKTDRDGVARLGPFKRFPTPPPGHQYRLTVDVAKAARRKGR